MSDPEFALRTDDGAIWPGDVCYVDGYGIAERLLEGVRFEVRIVTEDGCKMLACNGVHPDDAHYMEQFAEAKIKSWCCRAVEWLTEEDGDATAPDGTNVHWSDSQPGEAWPGAREDIRNLDNAPRMIDMHVPDFLKGGVK